ncbi:MAG: hypothetical protein ACOC8X_09635 [Chloroflexota bacterium]
MVEHSRSQTDPTVTEGSQEAKEKAQQVARETKARAEELGSQAQRQAQEMTAKAENQARSMLDQRKGQMASELNAVAQAFRETGGQLRQQDRRSVAQYSDRVADEVERFSGYLQQKDVDAVVHDAEEFARRQPEVFLGAAFGVGLLVARFFKSSSQGQQPMGDEWRQSESASYLPQRDTTPTLRNR